jgi:hypothetical protein
MRHSGSTASSVSNRSSNRAASSPSEASEKTQFRHDYLLSTAILEENAPGVLSYATNGVKCHVTWLMDLNGWSV